MPPQHKIALEVRMVVRQLRRIRVLQLAWRRPHWKVGVLPLIEKLVLEARPLVSEKVQPSPLKA